MVNPAKTARDEVSRLIREALARAVRDGVLSAAEISEVPVEVPKEKAHGDLASPVAMALARQARKAPRSIAEAIVERLPKDSRYIEKVEIAGPGFINAFLGREWVYDAIRDILGAGEDYGKSDIGRGMKVQVEFVSANPTGPMNVVNARAGAIGDSLVNLLNFTGHRAVREFYCNDAGNQVTILAESVDYRYRQKLGEDVELPDNCYQGEYVADIAAMAMEKHGEDLARMTRDERIEFFRDFAVSTITAWQRESLKKFGVEFDEWFSERALHESGAVADVVNLLKEEGHTYESEGALWFASTKFGDDKDRVLVKSDGAFTYIAPDLAYHRSKFERGFEHVIDILGPDHHGYLGRIRAGVEAMGYPRDALEVIILQLVTLTRGGEPVRMSKRAGEFITMDDVVDEVGKDAARYFFVMRNTDSHLDFDLELAKSQSQDNPVYYIQYAHARIASIFRQAAAAGLSGTAREALAVVDLSPLGTEAEVDLVKKLAQFPDEVVLATQERQPARIARYGLELAGAFHSFYTECRVVTEDTATTMARLALCEASRITLRNLLGLLGISAPERM